MENHHHLSDAGFEQQFAEARLRPELFTHEAHLRLAWIHLRKYGLEQAIKNICAQLQAFVAILGASDKFNKTVTVAAIRAVHHFMLKSESATFQEFIEKYPRLKYSFKELLEQHYQTDIFHSEEAKKNYLEPELLPFD